MNLCLFDLDDTLLPLDSDHAWGEFLIRLGWVDESEFRCRNHEFFKQYQAGQLDIHAYVAFTTRPLRGRDSKQLAAAHQRFMNEVIHPNLHPAAMDLVRCHQAQGDWVALVTATNDFVTGPIAKSFNIDHLIALRWARDNQGTITGLVDGIPSYREGKVTRVTEWLSEHRQSWENFDRISVYTDSLNDLPLLERATHPVATNPSPGLRQVAEARGWRTLQLFS
ncbi:MAG: HAD family hydrolase [Burkholderiales bacterium]|jgi:HAD superfamily hydrolase (TIGR01490 family)